MIKLPYFSPLVTIGTAPAEDTTKIPTTNLDTRIIVVTIITAVVVIVEDTVQVAVVMATHLSNDRGEIGKRNYGNINLHNHGCDL